MNLYEKLVAKEESLSLVGLGYVGMPIAVQFAKKVDVIGFDVNSSKIAEYKKGHDVTGEAGDDELKKTTMLFTNKEADLKNVNFYIVAVPTPVNLDKTPDLSPVVGASEVVGRNIEKGSIVVFEYIQALLKMCVSQLSKRFQDSR